MEMEISSPEAMRHGIKRVKLSANASMFISDDLDDDRELGHSKSRSMKICEWIEDPLDERMAAALQRDLEEVNEDVDAEEWVDDDLGVFGEEAIANPYKELQVEDIHGRGLPNASYVKAAWVNITSKEPSFEDWVSKDSSQDD